MRGRWLSDSEEFELACSKVDSELAARDAQTDGGEGPESPEEMTPRFRDHAEEIAWLREHVCRTCGGNLQDGFCSTCEAEGVDHGEGNYYSSQRMADVMRIGHE